MVDPKECGFEGRIDTTVNRVQERFPKGSCVSCTPCVSDTAQRVRTQIVG